MVRRETLAQFAQVAAAENPETLLAFKCAARQKAGVDMFLHPFPNELSHTAVSINGKAGPQIS